MPALTTVERRGSPGVCLVAVVVHPAFVPALRPSAPTGFSRQQTVSDDRPACLASGESAVHLVHSVDRPALGQPRPARSSHPAWDRDCGCGARAGGSGTPMVVHSEVFADLLKLSGVERDRKESASPAVRRAARSEQAVDVGEDRRTHGYEL